MSKADILGELPNLPRLERQEILERLWEMDEQELLSGVEPDADEKELLDQELADFQANPAAGAEWRQVLPRLRRQLHP